MARVCPKCKEKRKMTTHHILPKCHFGKTKETGELCRDCHDDLEYVLLLFEGKHKGKRRKMLPHYYRELWTLFVTS